MALFVSPVVPPVPPALPAPRPAVATQRVPSDATGKQTPFLASGLLAAAAGRARRVARGTRVRRRAHLEKRVLRESPYPDEKPYEGDLVRIHYVGRLSDGTCFDNSRTRGEPFEFILGESEVIDAWEILIKSMALKEKAELTCPPQYAYGTDGVPPYVPPNETVTFTVDLLDIGRPMQEEKEPVVDVSEDEEDEDENFWDKDEKREKGRCLGFNWEASGSGKEIFVRVPLSDDVRVKEIKVNITSTAITCKISEQMIIEGNLFAPVLTDDSFWDFEIKGKKVFLLITLGKLDASIKWTSLLEGGDPVKSTSKSTSAVDVEVVDVSEAKGAQPVDA